MVLNRAVRRQSASTKQRAGYRAVSAIAARTLLGRGAGAVTLNARIPGLVAGYALAVPMCAGAATGEPDTQLWTELDVNGTLSTHFSITGIGQLRLSESLSNPTLTAGGADLTYKNGDWSLSAGYRHQLTGNRQGETPNITQVTLLMTTYAHHIGKNTIAFRCRVENTITASSNPWRLRLRGEYRRSTDGLGPISYLYVNDEIFYQFSEREWFRNRFQAGTNLRLSKHTELRLYYQRQDSENSKPGAINALGVLAAVTL